MQWQEICENPILHNLPFKIETNKWGKIEMSPASNEHGIYQTLLVEKLLGLSTQGKPLTECSVQTSSGVKVADVAWASYDFYKVHKRACPYLQSPEIMIEIISPSNSRAEMNEKKQLYFDIGAREFWLCDKNGQMSFFNADKQLALSELMPTFPTLITIGFA